ncbi:uncharacterized protein, partial [Littorina saxatilis]|uniref:uncharacterized protein n=1 Tax=Littorina saxatilis TaxID=31220 RepID=UPI0038B5293E
MEDVTGPAVTAHAARKDCGVPSCVIRTVLLTVLVLPVSVMTATVKCATRGPMEQTAPLAVTRTVKEGVTRPAVAAHAASRDILALMFVMGCVQPSVPVVPVNVLLETVMDAKEGSLEVNVPAMPTVKEGATVLTDTVQVSPWIVA